MRGLLAAEGQSNDKGIPGRQTLADARDNRLPLAAVTGAIPTVAQIPGLFAGSKQHEAPFLFVSLNQITNEADYRACGNRRCLAEVSDLSSNSELFDVLADWNAQLKHAGVTFGPRP
jgi:hypothetical protein